MSPEFPDPVPVTTLEEIASPPTLMSVQPAPRLPFARLKLSEAETPANALSGIASENSDANNVTTRVPRAQRRKEREHLECSLEMCSFKESAPKRRRSTQQADS